MDGIVAPLAGAWIEISKTATIYFTTDVAPLAGAWIEIKMVTPINRPDVCRSPRGSVD